MNLTIENVLVPTPRSRGVRGGGKALIFGGLYDMLDYFVDCFCALLALVPEFLSLIGCGICIIIIKRFLFRGD